MRQLLLLAAASLLLPAAAAAEVRSPRDPSSGLPTGKVNLQDLHFSTRAEAVAKCPGGGAVPAPDGSFACDAATTPEPAGMAINEKGLPGTKTTVKAPPK